MGVWSARQSAAVPQCPFKLSQHLADVNSAFQIHFQKFCFCLYHFESCAALSQVGLLSLSCVMSAESYTEAEAWW